MHQTIKKVTKDVQSFKYNTAIAAIMEFVNLLIERGADNNTLKSLVLILAPFAPYITEEIYQRYYARNPKPKIPNSKQIQNSKFKESKLIGNFNSVHLQAWPKYNPKLVVEENVTIAVQVNGKLRGTLRIRLEQAADNKLVIKAAKESDKIKKWILGKEIKKEIFVPAKLINFVV